MTEKTTLTIERDQLLADVARLTFERDELQQHVSNLSEAIATINRCREAKAARDRAARDRAVAAKHSEIGDGEVK